MFKTITLFNTNIEEKNRDRFLIPDITDSNINLHNALQPYKTLFLDTDVTKTYSYSLIDEMNFSLTLPRPLTLPNGEVLSLYQGNYASVYSSFFSQHSTNASESLSYTYWFVDIENVPGDSAVTLHFKLDTIATYGYTYLTNLSPQVLVDRMHTDRWGGGSGLSLTTIKDPKLINSDFQFENTLGSTVQWQEINILDSKKDTNTLSVGAYVQSENNPESSESPRINLTIDNKTVNNMWAYAIFRRVGNYNLLKSTGNGYAFQKNINWGNILDFGSVVVPVALTNPQTAYLNSVGVLGEMPEGLVGGLFLSPIQICPSNDHTNSDWVFKTSAYNPTVEQDHPAIENISSFEEATQKGEIWYVWPRGIVQDDSWSLRPVLDLKIDGLNDGLKFNTIDELKIYVANNDPALLHPSITKMSLVCKGSKDIIIPIDIYNLLDHNNILFYFGFSDKGMNVTINMFNSTYNTFDLDTQLNSFSSAGATYLNNNRYQMEAQKAIIHTNIALQKTQSQNSIAQSGASMGSLSSIFSPSKMAGNALNIKYQKEYINELADSEQAQKEGINAVARDAYNGASTYTLSSGNSFTLFQSLNIPYFFTIKKETPNQFLMEKAFQYFERYGYNYNSYVDTTKELWWESRRRFNYLKITNSNMYNSNTVSKLNTNITNDIEQNLGFGVRLWRSIDTVYQKGTNIEKNLLMIP